MSHLLCSFSNLIPGNPGTLQTFLGVGVGVGGRVVGNSESNRRCGAGLIRSLNALINFMTFKRGSKVDRMTKALYRVSIISYKYLELHEILKLYPKLCFILYDINMYFDSF